MKLIFADNLWGSQGKLWLLFFAAFAIVFAMLANAELWTVESRWAAVCTQMLLRHDIFHPYRYCGTYYDKPLLSYWLIVGVAYLNGAINEFILRLPSACASFITIVCTYSLGTKLFNRNVGLIAGWLLITSYSFIFWSRVASADMLNLAGIMLAIYWYVSNKAKPNFFTYLVFFLITALTCLFKGLIGFVIPILVVLADIIVNKTWKQHLRYSLLIAFGLAVLVYLAPFVLSAVLPDQGVATSGLYEVFRENILRFFEPFDHKDPFYTYLIYLPLYTIPWILLFIPAFVNNLIKWLKLDNNSRWLMLAVILLFAFLTVSGSRRTYYILPLTPFVMLVTANWLQNALFMQRHQDTIKSLVLILYIMLFAWFGIVQHIINSKSDTMQVFAKNVQQAATKKAPWNKWQIEVFNADDNKAVFYLMPKKPVACYKSGQLMEKSTIIITQQKDLDYLQNILKNYQLINSEPGAAATVALVPK
ncbi:MAG: glycosyltransferase family 39 protein [Gammaproteobacteria bacterium]|nr:glycosyltransferase family 39 protein [Gammaproteobacteria bacterium]